jgi:TPR repeat protein
MVLVKQVDQRMLRSMGFISQCRQLFVSPPRPTTLQEALTAAEGGNAEAQFGLGLKYSSNSEATEDLALAAEWYRKAAVQGHPLAQFNLGIMLAAGQGVAQDEAAANAWNLRAAEGGDPAAQFAVGSKCHRRSAQFQAKECQESRLEAYKWYHLSADQGYLGSEAACQRLTLDLSREEVILGNQRAAAFVPRNTAHSPEDSSTVKLK